MTEQIEDAQVVEQSTEIGFLSSGDLKQAFKSKEAIEEKLAYIQQQVAGYVQAAQAVAEHKAAQELAKAKAETERVRLAAERAAQAALAQAAAERAAEAEAQAAAERERQEREADETNRKRIFGEISQAIQDLIHRVDPAEVADLVTSSIMQGSLPHVEVRF